MTNSIYLAPVIIPPSIATQNTPNPTNAKVSILSKIIEEIGDFFSQDPKIITCSVAFAAGLAIAGAFTGGIGSICLYALAGLAGIIPPVTVHAAHHSNEYHGYRN
ncbi:MAG: hypothetical protein COT84_02980 [Chlamydiae bacterium CG10_big_fil_rev_8_21_14_0_10_35_9]|nr:MAG: hypothetical protein COT84_02980 [Chlamydiae bacterium CG10_big_fil_rev_8_21_14_0_10_35_9]